MEAVLVQSGGVKSLPKFQRSKEQGVVSDMAYDASQMSSIQKKIKKNVCLCKCVCVRETDEGRGS